MSYARRADLLEDEENDRLVGHRDRLIGRGVNERPKPPPLAPGKNEGFHPFYPVALPPAKDSNSGRYNSAYELKKASAGKKNTPDTCLLGG